MMNYPKLAVLTAAVATLSTSGFAQLPTSKVLTMDVAQTIAQAAMARCRADGYKVTVLVVDGLNAPKAMIRDDGATASTTEVAKIEGHRHNALQPAVGPCHTSSGRHRGSARDHSGHYQCPGRCADQGW
jgi:hypothetical protein